MASLPADDFVMQPAPPRRSGRLPGLDALRGIAALAVLCYHASGHFGGGAPTIFAKGYLAVDFFFMLSGYVMARTYERRMAQGLAPARFLWARYRRLWPVMAVGAVLGVPLLTNEIGRHEWLAAIALANLLLVPVLVGRLIFPVNAAAWSILFELGANLVHGVVLWRLRTRTLALVAATALAATMWASVAHGAFDIGARPENVLGGIPRAMLSYTLGIVLWRRWRDRPPIAVPPVASFLAMPVFLLVTDFADPRSIPIDVAFVVLVCPTMIAGALAYQGMGSVARWSGLLSFPLYAVHMPLLHWAKEWGLCAIAGMTLALVVAGAMTLWMNRTAGFKTAPA